MVKFISSGLGWHILGRLFKFHHSWISKYCFQFGKEWSSLASRLHHAAWIRISLRNASEASRSVYSTSSGRKPVQRSQSFPPSCLHTESCKSQLYQPMGHFISWEKKKINKENRFHYVLYFKMFIERFLSSNETLHVIKTQKINIFVMPTAHNFG